MSWYLGINLEKEIWLIQINAISMTKPYRAEPKENAIAAPFKPHKLMKIYANPTWRITGIICSFGIIFANPFPWKKVYKVKQLDPITAPGRAISSTSAVGAKSMPYKKIIR